MGPRIRTLVLSEEKKEGRGGHSEFSSVDNKKPAAAAPSPVCGKRPYGTRNKGRRRFPSKEKK